MTVGIHGGSRVQLHHLSERRDADGWVVGRAETGDFIWAPDAAHDVIWLLRQGHTIDEAAARLRTETGTTFAVAEFVTALDGLGFLSTVDGHIRDDGAVVRPSLPWLRPGHVGWLLHPLAPAVVLGFAVTVVVTLALHPALSPGYHVLVWSRHAGLVLTVNAAIGWTIILMHELAHLATARAAGAPARITLATRLQFLAAQTDVSGVWAAPRRARMAVYVAGMAVNVCISGICLLILSFAYLHGLPRDLLTVTVAEALLALPLEFMVFMRTDVYFVLQDLTGCANLYADGSAYLRSIGLHIARRFVRTGLDKPDLISSYTSPQRRAVHVYSVVLLVGTVVCLGVGLAVSLPALILLLIRAAAEISARTPSAILDGWTALAIVLTWQSLWASRWWHHHQNRVRAWLGGTPWIHERR